ncbi:helix-turn-helix domain-containing protein [Salibacterium sp. K-3]
MIGERVVRFRMKREMTLDELASRTRISLQYLHDIEDNKWRYPSVDYMERIAEVLDVKIDDLVGPKTEEEEAAELDEKWLEVVQEAMSSNVSKEEFQKFLESRKKHTEKG